MKTQLPGFGCAMDDIEEEDVMQFDLGVKAYAVYHTPSGYYATEGLCTHEQAALSDGLVMGEQIECQISYSKWQGQARAGKTRPSDISSKKR